MIKNKNAKYFNDVHHMEENGACTKVIFAVTEIPKFQCFKGTKYEQPESVLISTTHLECERVKYIKISILRLYK